MNASNDKVGSVYGREWSVDGESAEVAEDSRHMRATRRRAMRAALHAKYPEWSRSKVRRTAQRVIAKTDVRL